jgi:hypothetical protein
MFEWVNGKMSGSKKEQKAAVIEWLEEVNRDLTRLSDLWLTIGNEESFRFDPTKFERTGFSALLTQGSTAARLNMFYESATAVIGGRTEGQWHCNFVHSLALLLLNRDRARAIIDGQRQMVRLDSRNDAATDLRDLRSAGIAIQNEIATLQVLITNFKAMP